MTSETIWLIVTVVFMSGGLIGMVASIEESITWFWVSISAFLVGVFLLISGAMTYSDDPLECELGQVNVVIEEYESCHEWSEVGHLVER